MWKVLFKQEMVGQNMEYTEDCPYPMEKIISPNSTNRILSQTPGCPGEVVRVNPLLPEKPMSTINVRVCVSEPLLITKCCNKPLSYLQLVE